ncbi:uncharacterized protein PV09_04844 [Verruconis gallopava]|uniref:RNA polymerase Rpb4/RPC9 core domain-containing protein n=1 Tax=Verruconis gallopava TaxID=253628 RepID=A0A0D2AY26_9PEZI|nr:uncharacterized protein PV09_04844 [Verruconis gallopava]KIW04019.1 hypothetical protein PV09_04844 [Verruconis gallopava]
MATNGSSTPLTPANTTRKLGPGGTVVTVPYHPPRERPRTDLDLEAGEVLNLGEFQDAHALSISEARLIVERTEQIRNKKGTKLRETENLSKMLTYMDAFSRFRTLNTLNQIETMLLPYTQLEQFEKAQIVTLCPGDPEEAKVLIPSLANKISDDVLRDILEQIDQLRQFNEE